MNKSLFFAILLFTILVSLPTVGVMPIHALDTGLKYPTTYVTGTTGNPPTDPEEALVDDVATGSTNDANCALFRTNNPGGGGGVADSEIYSDFSLGVPTSAVIDGIEVYVSAYRTGSPSLLNMKFDVRLNDQSAGIWTAYKSISSQLTATDYVYVLGGSGDDWGGSWIEDDFSNLNFKLEIKPTGDYVTGEHWKLDSVSVIVYYHLGLASIAGVKFYDLNTNSINDDGMVIVGWRIELWDSGETTLIDHQFTDGLGEYKFDNLEPGTYVVKEVLPIGQWVQTAPWPALDYTVTVSAGEDVIGKDFGNVCLGAGGGHTKGFWTNPNGEAKFGTLTDPIGLLTGLNLRNADGSDFDPTTYTELETWLQDADAVNMAYMLSAQLAAMELNVLAGATDAEFVDGSALVYAPDLIGQPGVNAAGFTSINNLMDLANTELGIHGNTPAGSPYRAYQEDLKDALDAANSNLIFVQATPYPFTTPY